MARTKWLVVTLLAALAASVAATASPPSASAAPCRPTVTILPDLGYGGGALAIHGNTVVGLVNDATGTDLPAYWRNGQLTLIDGPSEGYASGINAFGAIVGNGDFFSSPFAFLHGTLDPLAAPGGFDFVGKINDWGQISGAIDNYAVRWDSLSSQPVNLLPAPGDSYSFGHGINDLGQVAGDSDDANGVPHPAIWNLAGQIRVLQSGLGAGQPGILYAINQLGQSAGESYAVDANGITADQATRWSTNGVPTLIPFLPSADLSTGFGMNDLGWVSGLTFVNFDYGTGSSDGSHAFVWFGKGAAKTLPVPGYAYADSQSNAHFITNDGTAVGDSGPAGGPSSATVWTCVQSQAYVPGAAVSLPRHVAPREGVRRRVTFSWLRTNQMP
jgi:uncharacterized membrane protein